MTDATPARPARSGCFRGCAVAVAVAAVLCIVLVLLVRSHWRGIATKAMVREVIDPSALAADEKKEAADLCDQYFASVDSGKIDSDRLEKVSQEFAKANEDKSVEPWELRTAFGMMKKQLREAGMAFPSGLFMDVEAPHGPPAGWLVRIKSVPGARLQDVAAFLAKEKSLDVPTARRLVERPDAVVMVGAKESEAKEFAEELKKMECDAVMEERK